MIKKQKNLSYNNIFFSNQSFKSLDYTNSYNKYNKILLC